MGCHSSAQIQDYDEIEDDEVYSGYSDIVHHFPTEDIHANHVNLALVEKELFLRPQRLEETRFLYDESSGINRPHCTPLMAAALTGNLPVLRLLLRLGAAVNAVDKVR